MVVAQRRNQPYRPTMSLPSMGYVQTEWSVVAEQFGRDGRVGVALAKSVKPMKTNGNFQANPNTTVP
ncbi:hypothetical protein [Mesorhizobium comanense]|uniref:hypothetical protein n=1 Tax=Mesorhizobium comanense TaxID=2502215 RepID=UPI0010F6BF7F|nr:hypothetical protein [Mesorhizobium comanense]DAV95928.1 MAG TPA: hypothetical protein [Microviridae sp.]